MFPEAGKPFLLGTGVWRSFPDRPFSTALVLTFCLGQAAALNQAGGAQPRQTRFVRDSKTGERGARHEERLILVRLADGIVCAVWIGLPSIYNSWTKGAEEAGSSPETANCPIWSSRLSELGSLFA